jgi:hypothetical protein
VVDAECGLVHGHARRLFGESISKVLSLEVRPDQPPGSASQYEQTSTSSIPGPLKTADRIP